MMRSRPNIQGLINPRFYEMSDDGLIRGIS